VPDVVEIDAGQSRPLGKRLESPRDRVRVRRPASASLTPSINPSAAAGAPNVEVSRLGNNAVGTSCPTSAGRLAVPIRATPGVNHRRSGSTDSSEESRRSAMSASVTEPPSAPRGGGGRRLLS
jgi:hypothetical protein